MAKTRTMYVCENCGEESITWQGKCPICHEWNTFRELKISAPSATRASKASVSSEEAPRPLDLTLAQDEANRVSTGSREFDRVLGGGLMKGSVILLGGEPGIGKSTLLLQVADRLAKGKTVAYFSGEESPLQVAGRAKRLGLTPTFLFAAETRMPVIRDFLLRERPDIIIVDSIQTIYDDTYPSTPGSLVQVRECALQLQDLAKREGITTLLVGHITKEGTVAGPKTLEHMVDVVLYLEGEARSEVRILRSMKNRFGATYEVGLFAFEDAGLHDIGDPSVLFVENHSTAVPGTALTAVLEGARPILVEVQALVVPTVFGYPKRTSSGLDLQRLQILLAILESRLRCPVNSYDVFINVVGGYKIQDRGADLAVCMAIISAMSGVSLPPKQVYYGEVGLTGEIRSVAQSKRRKDEVERLGYTPVTDERSLQVLAKPYQSSRKKDPS